MPFHGPYSRPSGGFLARLAPEAHGRRWINAIIGPAETTLVGSVSSALSFSTERSSFIFIFTVPSATQP